MTIHIRALLVLLFLVAPILGGDDPNIPKATKQKVLNAMTAYVDQMKTDHEGLFPIFDHTRQTVTYLSFVALHQGVVKKGDQPLYVACADFSDAAGVQYDVDFFVNQRMKVVEALVHKKKKEKFPYTVE